MSSSYYSALIDKYKNVVSRVSSLYTYIGNATSNLGTCKTLISENTIDDNPIDKGMLDNISSTLQTLTSSLNTIVAECMSKIDYYTGLYHAALYAETHPTTPELDVIDG